MPLVSFYTALKHQKSRTFAKSRRKERKKTKDYRKRIKIEKE